MAPQAPDQAELIESAVEREPNDEATQATELQLSAAMSVLQAELTGGSADRDFWLLKPGAGPQVLSLTVLPRVERDLYLTASSADGRSRIELDDGLPGEAESIPNLTVPIEGLLLEVGCRGEDSVPYELTLTPLGSVEGLELEPNDQAQAPMLLTAPAALSAFVNRAGDVDVFSVRTELPSFDLSCTAPVDLALSVRLEHASSVLWQVRVEPGATQSFRRLRGTAEGYLLWVEGLGAARGVPAYRLELSPSVQSDNGEMEPNDQIPQQLPGAGSLKASLSAVSDVDRFLLPVPVAAGSQYLSIRAMAATESGMRLELLDANAQVLAQNSPSKPGSPLIICNYPVGEGAFEIKVSALPETQSLQEMNYELVTLLQSFEYMESEPNGELERATAIPAEAEAKGQIFPAEDVDVFSFEVSVADTEMQRVELRLSDGYMANLAMELKDSGGASISVADRMGYSEGERLVADLPAGRYYVFVSARGEASCTGAYALSLVRQPLAASPIPTTDGASSTQPTTGSVDDAEKVLRLLGDTAADSQREEPGTDPKRPGDDDGF
ncbi:MAG: PPC domain-containing protein [Myxococcota bacterium]|jgi:hypothetical protein|nr:PPC domain-containing protein [Myxococcota bacterium]